MNHDKTARILSLLEIGFRTDSTQLKALEKDLGSVLATGREFGDRPDLSDAWTSQWMRDWDAVEATLFRTGALIAEMDASIGGDDDDRLALAADSWEAIQSEDARLLESLGSIRTLVGALDASDRAAWNRVARTLESLLEDIHTCAQALRVKLELLKSLTRAEADRVILGVFAKLPGRVTGKPGDPELYDREYARAALELEREHHEFLGFADIVKGLLMWVESPEARMRSNRSLSVAEG